MLIFLPVIQPVIHQITVVKNHLSYFPFKIGSNKLNKPTNCWLLIWLTMKFSHYCRIWPATFVSAGSRFAFLGLWQQRWCDWPAPVTGKKPWCVSPFPPAGAEGRGIPSRERGIVLSPERGRHRLSDSTGIGITVDGFNGTYPAQLTFGCCHCCHDPGSLIRRGLFAKKLSAARGQLVLCLHGNDFLFDHLKIEKQREVLNWTEFVFLWKVENTSGVSCH